MHTAKLTINWNYEAVSYSAGIKNVYRIFRLLHAVGWLTETHTQGKQTLYFTQNTQNCNFNPLDAELNPFRHTLALFGAHPILHVSRIRVKEAISRL
jgi:Fe2+ or Zn2+ uptake regulation protein